MTLGQYIKKTEKSHEFIGNARDAIKSEGKIGE
jgi:hypothetical protein